MTAGAADSAVRTVEVKDATHLDFGYEVLAGPAAHPVVLCREPLVQILQHETGSVLFQQEVRRKSSRKAAFKSHTHQERQPSTHLAA